MGYIFGRMLCRFCGCGQFLLTTDQLAIRTYADYNDFGEHIYSVGYASSDTALNAAAYNVPFLSLFKELVGIIPNTRACP